MTSACNNLSMVMGGSAIWYREHHLVLTSSHFLRSRRLAQGLPGEGGGGRRGGRATSVPRHLFTGAVSTGLSCPAPAYMTKLQAHFLFLLQSSGRI